MPLLLSALAELFVYILPGSLFLSATIQKIGREAPAAGTSRPALALSLQRSIQQRIERHTWLTRLTVEEGPDRLRCETALDLGCCVVRERNVSDFGR